MIQNFNAIMTEDTTPIKKYLNCCELRKFIELERLKEVSNCTVLFRVYYYSLTENTHPAKLVLPLKSTK